VFIVYEYGLCVLAALIGATLLFTACVLFLVLKTGGGFLAAALQQVAIQLKGRRMPAESNDGPALGSPFIDADEQF
jgi:hypothetical protein